jgi:hypothetical protein
MRRANANQQFTAVQHCRMSKNHELTNHATWKQWVISWWKLGRGKVGDDVKIFGKTCKKSGFEGRAHEKGAKTKNHIGWIKRLVSAAVQMLWRISGVRTCLASRRTINKRRKNWPAKRGQVFWRKWEHPCSGNSQMPVIASFQPRVQQFKCLYSNK